MTKLLFIALLLAFNRADAYWFFRAEINSKGQTYIKDDQICQDFNWSESFLKGYCLPYKGNFACTMDGYDFAIIIAKSWLHCDVKLQKVLKSGAKAD